MNKKSILTIVSIASLLVGLILGSFTDVANDLPAIGLTAFGLGALILTTWKKSEKKNGTLVISILFTVASGIAAAFAEMTQDNFSKLISAVVAVVALITAILIPVISNALVKKNQSN